MALALVRWPLLVGAANWELVDHSPPLVLRHAQVLVSHSLVVTKATLRFYEVLRESVLAVNQNVPFACKIPLVVFIYVWSFIIYRQGQKVVFFVIWQLTPRFWPRRCFAV
jgi:hypothetical protein